MNLPREGGNVDGKTDLQQMGRRARAASRSLAKTSATIKNGALLGVADALVERMDEILDANAQDVDAGRCDGLSEQLLGRLTLDGNKLEGMAGDVRRVAELADPTEETFDANDACERS